MRKKKLKNCFLDTTQNSLGQPTPAFHGHSHVFFVLALLPLNEKGSWWLTGLPFF